MIAAWVFLALLGATAALHLPARLTNELALPGTESARAEEILGKHFQQRTVGSFTIVARVEGNAEAHVPDIESAARRAAAELPTGRLAWVLAVDDRVIAAHIVSSLEASQARRHVQGMREAIGGIHAADVHLTGFAATEHDLEPILHQDLVRGELLIALPLCIVLLLWTFRTGAFLVPLLVAAFTIPACLGLVFLCTSLLPLTTYVTNLVGLVGLGIAVDYSLLLMHRFREELGTGLAPCEAIEATMATAGHAVVFSGTAVAIGLAVMIFLPLPFLRGFGVGGLLIALVSVAAAVTLMPAILLRLGRSLDAVQLSPASHRLRMPDGGNDFWSSHARRVMRHPAAIAIGTTVILLAMAAPIRTLQLGPGSNAGLPAGLESVQGLEILASAVGEGATAPTTLLVDSGRPGGVDSNEIIAALGLLEIGLLSDHQVAFQYFDLHDPAFVDPTRRYAMVQVAGEEGFGTPESSAFVERLRSQIIPAAAFPSSAVVLAGGTPPAGRDFVQRVIESFPVLVLASLAATYILLVFAFRSLLLPAKAVVLNLLCVSAAYGLTVAAFSWGWGAPMGLVAHAQVEAWIPVLVFAMLFGLSMDYEVFIVCRMREYWDAGQSNEQAVAAGLATTGRLVTAAGLIMCAAFAGFMAGSVVALQQFGFTLAVAILIDISLIRMWLLPASMTLFGRWNWYLPTWVGRLIGMREPIREARSGR